MTKTQTNALTHAPHRSLMLIIAAGGRATSLQISQMAQVGRSIAKDHVNELLRCGLIVRKGPMTRCWYEVVQNPPPFELVKVRSFPRSDKQRAQAKKLAEINRAAGEARRAARKAEQEAMADDDFAEDELPVHRLVPAGEWRVNRLHLPPNSVWQLAAHQGASA